MYNAALTVALPPHTVRLPRKAPESLLSGATPTKAASCLGGRLPSSGSSAKSVLATTGPTPGTPRSSSSFSRQVGLSSIASSRSRSMRESSFSNHLTCASRRLRTALVVATPRRLFSAVSIPTTCRRRAVISANAWASSSGTGPGELACLPGVYHRDRQPSGGQSRGHRAFEAPGGLQDHQHGTLL